MLGSVELYSLTSDKKTVPCSFDVGKLKKILDTSLLAELLDLVPLGQGQSALYRTDRTIDFTNSRREVNRLFGQQPHPLACKLDKYGKPVP